MASNHEAQPQTEVLSRGYNPKWSEGACVPPVFRTSTFCFSCAEQGKQAFSAAYGLRKLNPGEVPELIYSRVNNPNVEMVEDRVTLWDQEAPRNGGKVKACLFSAGMAAVSNSVLTFLKPGDEIVFTNPVYGGTEAYLRHVLPNYGFPTHEVPAGCTEAQLDEAVKKTNGKCRIIYTETPANPTITMTDIELVARVADKYSTAERRVLVVCDNTFLGPLFCRPHKHGADIVVYSATKYIGGHSDVVAGVATAAADLIGAIKGTRTIFGSVLGPDEAWLLLRSMSTLELRMKASMANALEICKFLEQHPAVSKVLYPGRTMDGVNQSEIYKKQCTGSGSMITFFIKGGEKEAFTVLDNLKHIRLAVSLGGVESLIEHPRTMTHSDMTIQELDNAGILPSMIRLSVGIEDAHDLVEDIKHALDLIVKH